MYIRTMAASFWPSFRKERVPLRHCWTPTSSFTTSFSRFLGPTNCWKCHSPYCHLSLFEIGVTKRFSSKNAFFLRSNPIVQNVKLPPTKRIRHHILGGGLRGPMMLGSKHTGDRFQNGLSPFALWRSSSSERKQMTKNYAAA